MPLTAPGLAERGEKPAGVATYTRAALKHVLNVLAAASVMFAAEAGGGLHHENQVRAATTTPLADGAMQARLENFDRTLRGSGGGFAPAENVMGAYHDGELDALPLAGFVNAGLAAGLNISGDTLTLGEDRYQVAVSHGGKKDFYYLIVNGTRAFSVGNRPEQVGSIIGSMIRASGFRVNVSELMKRADASYLTK